MLAQSLIDFQQGGRSSDEKLEDGGDDPGHTQKQSRTT